MARRTGSARRRRRSDEEHHENLERWLLTYADMITLLLLFFILLYTISSMNIGKYKEISSALSSAFSGGNFGLLFDKSNTGTADESSITPNQPAQVSKVKNQSMLYTRAVSQLNLLIRQNLVRVTSNETGLTITLAADTQFKSGSADIQQQFLPVIQQVAQFLNTVPNEIRVEGHTDNTPVDGTQYTSNYSLAADRAINVLTTLEDYGVKGDRMYAVSYGDIRPLMSNDTEEGRAYNRRVDIVVLQQPENQ
jgi:chemotaxis protein MotB